MLFLRRRYFRLVLLALLLLAFLLPPAIAQTQQQTHQTSPLIALGPIDLNGLEGSDGSMTPHGENDPHVRMTAMRAPKAEDQAVADEIAEELKGAIAKYADISVAEADDYFPFPADSSGLRIVHYVNVYRSWQENWRLNPQEPGSLLYERQPDSSLKLIGAMFVAPDDATEAELDERMPLSVTQWHLHTNICVPDPIWDSEQWKIEDNGAPRFGPQSAIATEVACAEVGGDFMPTAFGWMVHAYVFADNPSDVWNQMY